MKDRSSVPVLVDVFGSWLRDDRIHKGLHKIQFNQAEATLLPGAQITHRKAIINLHPN